MRNIQLGAAVALVATTQAFFIPPIITSVDDDIINTLPFEDAMAIEDRVVDIDCPGCPVLTTDIQGHMHSSQVESLLRFNLTIAHNEFDQLLLNGAPIYPINIESTPSNILADQLVQSSAGTWEYSTSPELGYAIRVHHPATTSNQDELDLIAINFEILDVGGVIVDGVPSIDIKLLETPSGKLMIGDADALPATIPASNPSEKCTSFLCKLRQVINGKFSHKGCAGKASHKGDHKGHMGHMGHKGHNGDKSTHKGDWHKTGKHYGHGAHTHRHYRQHNAIVRFLRSIVLHVFMPVMIGVVVGITTSLLGMIVGHFIVFVWRMLFRRGQRGQYTRVQQEAGEEDESIKEFLAPQGPPPMYEDAPKYEEVVVDEKASE
jgi:hypothetical protein